MKYPSGERLEQIGQWIETKLSPRMQEAMQGIQSAQNGKFVKRVELLKKGMKIVEWYRKAKSAERQVWGIENTMRPYFLLNGRETNLNK